MAVSGTRVATRVALIGAGGLGLDAVTSPFRDPTWQEADEQFKNQAFYGSILIMGLLVGMLVVIDVWLGHLERASDGPERSPRLLAGLAAGLALTAGVMVLLTRWAYSDPAPVPTVSVEEGRARAEAVLDRVIEVAGSQPPDLAAAIRDATGTRHQDCTHRGQRYGGTLTWEHETRRDVSASTVRFSPYGVAELTADARARGARMAAVLAADGYVVTDDSSASEISFRAQARDPKKAALAYLTVWIRVGPTSSGDVGTVPLETRLLALSPCLAA